MNEHGLRLKNRAEAARLALKRLNEQTPDEARDEQGWTPELLAAAERQAELDRAYEEWFMREYGIERRSSPADE
jgi:hypothetical protein